MVYHSPHNYHGWYSCPGFERDSPKNRVPNFIYLNWHADRAAMAAMDPIMETTLSVAQQLVDFLKVGGPYAISVILGFVVWRLWKTNEELHKRLERKK